MAEDHDRKQLVRKGLLRDFATERGKGEKRSTAWRSVAITTALRLSELQDEMRIREAKLKQIEEERKVCDYDPLHDALNFEGVMVSGTFLRTLPEIEGNIRKTETDRDEWQRRALAAEQRVRELECLTRKGSHDASPDGSATE